jgi:hypothetical protein
MSTINEVISFFLPARGVFLAGREIGDHEVGLVGMGDEVLGAVQHPVIAVLHRRCLHAAQVRARARLGHRHAVDLLAAHARISVAFALLLVAGHQDVRWPCHAVPVQRVVGAAKLLFVEHPGQRIEPCTAHFFGHVGGIKPGLDGLCLQLFIQLAAQLAGALDFRLVGVQLVLDERARRVDDHLLFFGEVEVHESYSEW